MSYRTFLDGRWICGTFCSPLINAARYGQTAAVAKLVESGVNIDTVDENGWTALMHASSTGQAAVVQMLVDEGADLDAAEEDGWTALLLAAYYCHATVVQFLAHSGADVEARLNDNGCTALICAAANGDLATTRVLIDAGADVNNADVDGDTALMLAAAAGHSDLVEALLDADADIDAQNNLRRSALMVAASAGNNGTVMTLLARGADPLLQDLDGRTAGTMSATTEIRARLAMHRIHHMLQHTKEIVEQATTQSSPVVSHSSERHTQTNDPGADPEDPQPERDPEGDSEDDPEDDPEGDPEDNPEANPEEDLSHERLSQLCDMLITEFEHAPQFANAIHKRDELRARFTAVRDVCADFEALGQLGGALKASEEMVAQLPLSEEQYATLADRQAALVREVTEACGQLISAGQFESVTALGTKLKKLEALDVSTPACAHASERRPSLSLEDALLLNESNTIITQFAQAPPLLEALQRRDGLQRELDALRACPTEDFAEAVRVGKALQAANAAVAALPLAVSDHLTLADRRAALMQTLTHRCRQLVDAENYDVLEILAGKLGELRVLSEERVLQSSTQDGARISASDGSASPSSSDSVAAAAEQLPLSGRKLEQLITALSSEAEVARADTVEPLAPAPPPAHSSTSTAPPLLSVEAADLPSVPALAVLPAADTSTADGHADEGAGCSPEEEWQDDLIWH